MPGTPQASRSFASISVIASLRAKSREGLWVNHHQQQQQQQQPWKRALYSNRHVWLARPAVGYWKKLWHWDRNNVATVRQRQRGRGLNWRKRFSAAKRCFAHLTGTSRTRFICSNACERNVTRRASLFCLFGASRLNQLAGSSATMSIENDFLIARSIITRKMREPPACRPRTASWLTPRRLLRSLGASNAETPWRSDELSAILSLAQHLKQKHGESRVFHLCSFVVFLAPSNNVHACILGTVCASVLLHFGMLACARTFSRWLWFDQGLLETAQS